MTFPPGRGPIAVAAARAADTVPEASALTGGALYSIKVDGWRLVINRSRDGVELRSRHGTDLTSRFPEIAGAALTALPPGTVVDGEVAVYVDGRFEWGELQRRSASPRRSEPPRPPASYVAFDLLALRGQDLRDQALRTRWADLTTLASGWEPPLQLVMQTDDRSLALEWFDLLRDIGVEGIVAKAAEGRYRSGSRSGWIKIKNRHTEYGIVGAVVGPLTRPQAIVVGRYTDGGELVIVGRSTPLGSAISTEIAAAVQAMQSDQHPWPHQISAGYGGGVVDLTHVDPQLVVEVSADTALLGGRWRHAVRLTRLRQDLTTGQVPRYHHQHG